MTDLIKAYQKYKDTNDLISFEDYVLLIYPSQVSQTIEHYETRLYRLQQALNSVSARWNLRFNLALRYLEGQELSGADWDYFSEEDAKRIDEAIKERLKQAAKLPDPDSLCPASDFDFECQMRLDEFILFESYGTFTPDDGFGNYGTETHVSNVSCWEEPPEWATHVYWYNK